MKNYIICILIITAIHKAQSYLLEAQNKKICANCKYFISKKNECKKFGEINIITGKYDYEDALNVRNDEEKCGDDAIFFKKKYLKFVDISNEFLLDNIKIIFLLSYSGLPLIIWYLIFVIH